MNAILKYIFFWLILAVATAGCSSSVELINGNEDPPPVEKNSGDGENPQDADESSGNGEEPPGDENSGDDTGYQPADENNAENDISFTEYFTDSSCQWINQISYPLQSGIIVINNNHDLGKYFKFSEGCFSEIDFSKNSLLLVTGVSWDVIANISKNLQKHSTNYVLNVEMTVLKNTNYRQRWIIALVVNKLIEESNIELNVMSYFDTEEEPKFLEIKPGIYIETDPIKGNNILNFIDDERLLYAKGGIERFDEFKYKINGYTIELTLVEDSEVTTYHYFRIIDEQKFEIGNLYITNHMGNTIPPTVYFLKQ